MGKYSQAAQRRFRRVGSGTSLCLRYRLPRVGRLPRAPQLSRQAKLRLKVLEYRRTHSVSATARHFGLARSTVYRWQGRFDPTNLLSLENRSSRPTRVRTRSWTAAQVAAVQAAREAHPRWGKDKLAVVLRRQGIPLSVSMIGRILTDLKRRGVLVEPPMAPVRPHRRHRRLHQHPAPLQVGQDAADHRHRKGDALAAQHNRELVFAPARVRLPGGLHRGDLRGRPAPGPHPRGPRRAIL